MVYFQDHHRPRLLDLHGQAALPDPDGAAAERALPADERLQTGAARPQRHRAQRQDGGARRPARREHAQRLGQGEDFSGMYTMQA